MPMVIQTSRVEHAISLLSAYSLFICWSPGGVHGIMEAPSTGMLSCIPLGTAGCLMAPTLLSVGDLLTQSCPVPASECEQGHYSHLTPGFLVFTWLLDWLSWVSNCAIRILTWFGFFIFLILLPLFPIRRKEKSRKDKAFRIRQIGSNCCLLAMWCGRRYLAFLSLSFLISKMSMTIPVIEHCGED